MDKLYNVYYLIMEHAIVAVFVRTENLLKYQDNYLETVNVKQRKIVHMCVCSKRIVPLKLSYCQHKTEAKHCRGNYKN